MKNVIKYAGAWPALLMAFWVTISASAQNTVVSASSQSATTNYEGVYMVIKADTKPETLTGIQEKFKKVSIGFKVNDVIVKNGRITKITVSVDVPGIYSGTITSGNSQEPITNPIYFFTEAGKASLSSGGVPDSISQRGRLVVTDNLNGIAILYDQDNMELVGSASTKWKSR